MHKKNRAAAIILISVLLLSLLSGCSVKISYDSPKAVEGRLDITEQLLKEKLIKLDGQWEFYWNRLIDPENISDHDSTADFINLPNSWNKYISNQKELSGEGYATYRLRFITGDIGRLAVKIPRIFTAYKLWVNGELIASAGIIGESRETMEPQYLPQIALFDSLEGENEIIIQVSNFYHRSGGILESILIGNEKQILDMRYRRVSSDILLFGCLIIMGLYHIILFFFRVKNLPPLYFGLFCLLVAIRTLLVGERMFIYYFPSFSWEIAHKLQTLTFYLGTPLIVTYFMSVFQKYFNKKIVRIIQLIALAFSVVVLLTPARIFTVINPAYQVFAYLVILYLIITFIIITVKKEKYVSLIIIGGLALILTSVNDMIFLSVWMNDYSVPFLRAIIRTGSLSSVGQMMFVFANSIVLAKRFSNSLDQEEVITEQLKEINQSLDELVSKRTEALEKSNKEIENQKHELEKANKALRLISLKDPLTGLWNRRLYDKYIRIEWNRCLRYHRYISFLIVDIDYFKEYNDTYGHIVGDECLVKIANTIRKQFKRTSDLVARFGGEEFIAVMPEADKAQAMEMAELVRKSIEGLNIPHKCSSVSSWVTVSIGVTSIIPADNNSIDELYRFADKGLYKAKKAGRNQCVYWEVDRLTSKISRNL